MNIQYLLQVDLFLLLITTGRLLSVVMGLVGLISIVIGRQALAHSTGVIGPRRLKAITELVMGLIGISFSILHISRSVGSFGTGSGKLGAIVAMVMGLIGAALGCLALARSRQSRSDGS